MSGGNIDRATLTRILAPDSHHCSVKLTVTVITTGTG